MEKERRMGFLVAKEEFFFINYQHNLTLDTIQVRAWTISMNVHACMTHPALFVFSPVIRVWLQAECYLQK